MKRFMLYSMDRIEIPEYYYKINKINHQILSNYNIIVDIIIIKFKKNKKYRDKQKLEKLYKSSQIKIENTYMDKEKLKSF